MNFWKDRRVLITGGAGFIGSNLARRLLTLTKEVRILDNFSTGKRQNLPDSLNSFTIIEADLRDFALVMEAVKGVDIIFHLAALPSVYRSVRAPTTTNEVNITGTLNILQAARQWKVERVVYASSSSVYGDSEKLPKHEDMAPNPISPYAVSKLTGEYYCRSFWRLYAFHTVILRYFNVYGPYQDPSSEYSGVIAKFIHNMLQHKPLTIYGDGEQSRDFTYVEDVVEATILAASSDYAGEVFNVARGKGVTLNQMIEILKEIFKENPETIYTKPRPGDVRHSQADITKLKKKLKFTPGISFKEGLKRTVEWYRTAKHFSIKT